jgi:hypothetical protein
MEQETKRNKKGETQGQGGKSVIYHQTQEIRKKGK